MTAAVFCIDDGVEKKGDEIGEVIGMEVRYEKMCDAVTVHSGVEKVGKGSGSEIEQERVVGLDKITCPCTSRMDVGA